MLRYLKVEVAAPLCDCAIGAATDVADIGEPFRAQQILGDVRRREADVRVWRPAGAWSSPAAPRRRAMCRAPKDARGAGRGQGGEKIAARLHDMHAKSPLRSPASISNRVASASGLITGATAARIKALFGCHCGMMARSTGRGKRLGPTFTLDPGVASSTLLGGDACGGWCRERRSARGRRPNSARAPRLRSSRNRQSRAERW